MSRNPIDWVYKHHYYDISSVVLEKEHAVSKMCCCITCVDNVLTTNAIYESSDTRPLALEGKVSPQSGKGTCYCNIVCSEM